ncbi:MAG: aa3-type cytochrome oxidase subunit III [Acidimicrobiales bacterium]
MTVEAAAPPAAAGRAPRPPMLAVGTVVWLASELMFFSGLFAAYFTLRSTARGPWPPEGVELDAATAGLFTLALLASSGTIQLAVRALTNNDRAAFRRWLLVTAALAALFLANQGREWATATFDTDSNTFGSAFYLMTGFHGLHVLGGILAMFVLVARATSPRFGPADVPAAEVVSYYWHFVDVVWIGMYTTLFLIS